MVIIVKKIAPEAMTFEEGEHVDRAVTKSLASQDQVTVSFQGITSVPTSFVNGSFVQWLDHMRLDAIKAKISVIRPNRQISDLIIGRLNFVTEAHSLV